MVVIEEGPIKETDKIILLKTTVVCGLLLPVGLWMALRVIVWLPVERENSKTVGRAYLGRLWNPKKNNFLEVKLIPVANQSK